MASDDGLFHFFALCEEGNSLKVKRIHTNQGLQTELTALFKQQAADFLQPNLEHIDFDGSYKVDESEVFVISGFALPESFTNAPKHPTQYEAVAFDKGQVPQIKSVFAATFGHKESASSFYFQAFSRSQLLVKSFTILHSQTTFHRMKEPGLTLSPKLSAVYQDGRLFFRSYTVVNRFLDVKDYFREATNEEIAKVVKHPLLLAEDEEQIAKQSDSWMRKRFSALMASGILDQITPRKTANRAEKYGITLAIKKKDGKDAIVWPSDRRQMKRLLAFLNESFYQGELTDKLYQTNSHRALRGNAQPGGGVQAE